MHNSIKRFWSSRHFVAVSAQSPSLHVSSLFVPGGTSLTHYLCGVGSLAQSLACYTALLHASILSEKAVVRTMATASGHFSQSHLTNHPQNKTGTCVLHWPGPAPSLLLKQYNYWRGTIYYFRTGQAKGIEFSMSGQSHSRSRWTEFTSKNEPTATLACFDLLAITPGQEQRGWQQCGLPRSTVYKHSRYKP